MSDLTPTLLAATQEIMKLLAQGDYEGLVPGRYEASAIVDNRNRPCGTLEAGATDVELVVSE